MQISLLIMNSNLKSSEKQLAATNADEKSVSEHDKLDGGNIMNPEKSQTKTNEKQLATNVEQKKVSEHDVEPSEQFAKLELPSSVVEVMKPFRPRYRRVRRRRNSDPYERTLFRGRDYTDSDEEDGFWCNACLNFLK